MQYLLLIYGSEEKWNALEPEEEAAVYAAYSQLSRDLAESGKLVSANELQPVATAKSVRVRDGETLVTDGPFAETTEVLGGYYLIEAESEQEALEWAARIPSAAAGTVEVRPVVTERVEARA